MKLFVAPSKNSAEHHARMTEAPVGPLIISLAIPTIISMLVTTLYNTADTYFVSQLGTSASGAVGVVFSLMAIFQAIGFTLGMGSGSMIARDAFSVFRAAPAAVSYTHLTLPTIA